MGPSWLYEEIEGKEERKREMALKVCVGNYGYYNEGELHDAWIELPADPERIGGFLKENRLWDPMHEEIYISDYDEVPFGLSSLFGECTPLDELNMLAEQMDVDDYDEDAIRAYCEACDAPSSIAELMNLIAQSDEIPYYRYDKKGHSPMQSMGLTMVANDPDLEEFLDEHPDIEYAFDYERYGECFDQEYTALENGYIECRQDGPDFDRYSLDELRALYGMGDVDVAA